MEKIKIISISLLLFIYLQIQLCFQIINAQESLYPLTPQSPERTITNMKCDESEYQFIYNPKKHKRISCKSLIKEEFLKKEYIAKEIFERHTQELNLLHPTKLFPNYPRTMYFKNPYAEKEIKLNKKYKIEKVKIKDKKYMVTMELNRTYNITKAVASLNKIIKTDSRLEANLLYHYILMLKPNRKYLKSISKYQKYRYIPSCYSMHAKKSLYQHYEEFHEMYPKDFNYMPKTYEIPLSKKAYKKFSKYKFDKENLWIIKSAWNSRGNSVVILGSKFDEEEYLNQQTLPNGLSKPYKKPKDDSNKKLRTYTVDDFPKSGILSKYISNPYLINKHKFDLRIYVLVTGISPLKIYVYKEGLTRFAGSKYSNSKKKLSDRHVYLTNYEVAKTSKNFKQNNEENKENGLKWTISTLRKHFEKEGIDFENKIWSQIKDIIVKIFITYYEFNVERLKQFKLNSQNLFDIYGVDILIDDNLKAWLLEVNMQPSLATESHLDLMVKSNLITDIYNIIGIVPYSHSFNKESMDPSPSYKNSIEEDVYNSFVEFERPYGDFERVFPRKSTINYYKKFFKGINTVENKKLWKLMKKLDYE